MALSPHLLSSHSRAGATGWASWGAAEDLTQLSEGNPEGAQRPEGRQGNRSRPKVGGGRQGLEVAQGTAITPSLNNELHDRDRVIASMGTGPRCRPGA